MIFLILVVFVFSLSLSHSINLVRNVTILLLLQENHFWLICHLYCISGFYSLISTLISIISIPFVFNGFGFSNSLIIYRDYLIFSLSSFVIYNFEVINFLLSTVFTSPHKFYCVVFLFSLWFSKKYFLTPFETACLTHRFSLSVLLNSQYLAVPGYIFFINF